MARGRLSDVSIGSDGRGVTHRRALPQGGERDQTGGTAITFPREIDDELFDLDERCDRMALYTKGDGIGGHVSLLHSISTIIFSLRQASLATASYAQPATYRPTL